jgi:hypothetical protein
VCEGPLGRPRSASPVTERSPLRGQGRKATADPGRLAAPKDESG